MTKELLGRPLAAFCDFFKIRENDGVQHPVMETDRNLLHRIKSGEQLRLDLFGIDILPVGKHNNILLSAGNEKKAILIHESKISCVQPAVADHGGCFFRAVVVPLHYMTSPDGDFTVDDTHFDGGTDVPARPDPQGSRMRERNERRSLRHPVAGKHVESKRFKVPCNIVVDRRAAADQKTDFPSKTLMDLFEQKLGEPRMINFFCQSEKSPRGKTFLYLLPDALYEHAVETRNSDDHCDSVVLERLQYIPRTYRR